MLFQIYYQPRAQQQIYIQGSGRPTLLNITILQARRPYKIYYSVKQCSTPGEWVGRQGSRFVFEHYFTLQPTYSYQHIRFIYSVQAGQQLQVENHKYCYIAIGLYSSIAQWHYSTRLVGRLSIYQPTAIFQSRQQICIISPEGYISDL